MSLGFAYVRRDRVRLQYHAGPSTTQEEAYIYIYYIYTVHVDVCCFLPRTSYLDNNSSGAVHSNPDSPNDQAAYENDILAYVHVMMSWPRLGASSGDWQLHVVLEGLQFFPQLENCWSLCGTQLFVDSQCLLIGNQCFLSAF